VVVLLLMLLLLAGPVQQTATLHLHKAAAAAAAAAAAGWLCTADNGLARHWRHLKWGAQGGLGGEGTPWCMDEVQQSAA